MDKVFVCVGERERGRLCDREEERDRVTGEIKTVNDKERKRLGIKEREEYRRRHREREIESHLDAYI